MRRVDSYPQVVSKNLPLGGIIIVELKKIEYRL